MTYIALIIKGGFRAGQTMVRVDEFDPGTASDFMANRATDKKSLMRETVADELVTRAGFTRNSPWAWVSDNIGGDDDTGIWAASCQPAR